LVIIHWCNFDTKQHRMWIDLAYKMNAVAEWVVFNYEREVCIERCRRRSGHKRVRPSKAARIMMGVAGRFQPPCRDGERFQNLAWVSFRLMLNKLVDYYLQR
jgi:hypothetical protein